MNKAGCLPASLDDREYLGRLVRLAAMLVVVGSTAVFAQDADGPATSPPAPFRLELRIGSRVPPDTGPDETGSVVLGGLIGIPLGDHSLRRRLSVQVAIDFVELQSQTFEDPTFGLARHWNYLITVAPRLAVALVETPRLRLDVHGGVALAINRTTFGLETTPDVTVVPGGVVSSGDHFENVCDLTFFSSRCRNTYDGLASMGGGARILRTPGGKLFFGGDYAWHSNGKHLIVGTIGWLQ